MFPGTVVVKQTSFGETCHKIVLSGVMGFFFNSKCWQKVAAVEAALNLQSYQNIFLNTKSFCSYHKNVDDQVFKCCKDILTLVCRPKKHQKREIWISAIPWQSENSICCWRSWSISSSCFSWFVHVFLKNSGLSSFSCVSCLVCRSQPHVSVPDASQRSQPLHLVLRWRDAAVRPEWRIFHLLLARPGRSHMDLLVWNTGSVLSSKGSLYFLYLLTFHISALPCDFFTWIIQTAFSFGEKRLVVKALVCASVTLQSLFLRKM